MTLYEAVHSLGPFTISVFGLLTYLGSCLIFNVYFHPLSSIRGPRLWSAVRLPFIHSLLSGSFIHDIKKLHETYGPVVRIGPNEVCFAQPEAWDDILQPPRLGHQQFLKDPVWWKRQPGHPESLTSAIDPATHARIRHALAPALSARALRSQEPFLHLYVNKLIERLGEYESQNPGVDGSKIDIGPWCHYTTFDIFGDLAFGESFDCLEHSRLHPWIALLFGSVKAATFVAAARFYPLVYHALLKCIPPSLRKKQEDHYHQIVDKVQRRLNFELSRPDFMSHVLEDGKLKGMSRDELDATFMILATAGSETTASVLSGTLNLLANHQDKMHILAQEIRTRFSSPGNITLEAISNILYLDAVLNEGLRLCTPIPWVLPRQVPPGGDTVCGHWLPAGTSVSINAYAMNRDPKIFHRPASFLPERWLPDASTNPASPFFQDRRHALQPFLLGPRACLGQNLAWAEMRLITTKLLWHFDFNAIEGQEMRWEDLKTFFLVEKKPIPLHMKSRTGI